MVLMQNAPTNCPAGSKSRSPWIIGGIDGLKWKLESSNKVAKSVVVFCFRCFRFIVFPRLSSPIFRSAFRTETLELHVLTSQARLRWPSSLGMRGRWGSGHCRRGACIQLAVTMGEIEPRPMNVAENWLAEPDSSRAFRSCR